jgi:hypothetical protein
MNTYGAPVVVMDLNAGAVQSPVYTDATILKIYVSKLLAYWTDPMFLLKEGTSPKLPYHVEYSNNNDLMARLVGALEACFPNNAEVSKTLSRKRKWADEQTRQQAALDSIWKTNVCDDALMRETALKVVESLAEKRVDWKDDEEGAAGSKTVFQLMSADDIVKRLMQHINARITPHVLAAVSAQQRPTGLRSRVDLQATELLLRLQALLA